MSNGAKYEKSIYMCVYTYEIKLIEDELIPLPLLRYAYVTDNSL